MKWIVLIIISLYDILLLKYEYVHIVYRGYAKNSENQKKKKKEIRYQNNNCEH